MKKYYIIKYADGRDCREINSYESRNEASDALMKYLYSHNEYLSVNDDNYLSPFDFKIEEVDVKDVNEVITDFESARKALGIKSNADFYVVKRKHSEKVANLEDVARLALLGNVARLVTDINPKHLKALIALNKLFTIAQAWNKEVDLYPISRIGNKTSGFLGSCMTRMLRGSCMRLRILRRRIRMRISVLGFASNRPRAAQFGKQFAHLYNKVFL